MMVGIGGRSKGCETCSKRRIKCDESRPTCLRCRKAKLPCPGYKDIATFVSFEAGKTGPQRLNASLMLQSQNQLVSTSKNLSHPDLRSVSWPRDELCIAYARTNLSQLWSKPSKWDLVPSGWSGTYKEVEENLVQSALISLARTLFAYRFGQIHVQREGFKLYRQVLSALQEALRQPDLFQRRDVLETILALRAFDSFIPFHQGAWIQHSLAIEQLLQARGPHAYSDSESLQLLEYARPLVIMGCLAMKKSTILGREEWLTVPWTKANTRKRYVERLVDIFVDLPTALHGNEVLENPSFSRIDSIRLQVWKILNRLQDWRSELDLEFPGQIRDVDHNLPEDFGIRRLWPKGLEFPCLKVAEAFALHGAVCSIALDSAFARDLEDLHCDDCVRRDATLSTKSQTYLSSTGQMYSTVKMAEIYHRMMAEICRAISYLFSTAIPRPQPTEILIPLRQIWIRTRRLRCPMAVWLDKVVGKIFSQTTAGLPLFLYK